MINKDRLINEFIELVSIPCPSKGEKEEAARAFLAYLETDAAMTVFERVGFSAVY